MADILVILAPVNGGHDQEWEHLFVRLSGLRHERGPRHREWCTNTEPRDPTILRNQRDVNLALALREDDDVRLSRAMITPGGGIFVGALGLPGTVAEAGEFD